MTSAWFVVRFHDPLCSLRMLELAFHSHFVGVFDITLRQRWLLANHPNPQSNGFDLVCALPLYGTSPPAYALDVITFR